MKTSKFFAAFALVSASFMSPVAAHILDNQEPIEVRDVIINAAATTINVKLGTIGKDVVSIKIEKKGQADNAAVFVENVKTEKIFSRLYNVAGYEDGVYQLVITKTIKRITQSFTIANGQLILSGADKVETFLPIFSFKEDKLDVNYFLGKNAGVTIKMRDAKGDVLFTKNINAVINVHTRYNLSGLSAGNYRVELVANGESFFYDLTK